MRFLLTLSCVLSSGIWLAVGLYKVTHVKRMCDVIRDHSIPFPVAAFWLSVTIELGGAILMITQMYIWLVASLWLGFLIVATPIFHGRILKDDTIEYSQLVQLAKNVSIAGGLVALIILDGEIPAFLARF